MAKRHLGGAGSNFGFMQRCYCQRCKDYESGRSDESLLEEITLQFRLNQSLFGVHESTEACCAKLKEIDMALQNQEETAGDANPMKKVYASFESHGDPGMKNLKE